MNDLVTVPAEPARTVGELLEELEVMRHQMEAKVERIQDLEHDIATLRGFASQLREAIGEKAKWETESIRIRDKWRTRNHQLAQELQLAQVGLTSGCGCPIGECQQRGADQGQCWMLWAEAHVLKRMANMRIGDLQNASHHPTRFAKIRAEGGPTAKRLASPDPTD